MNELLLAGVIMTVGIAWSWIRIVKRRRCKEQGHELKANGRCRWCGVKPNGRWYAK